MLYETKCPVCHTPRYFARISPPDGIKTECPVPFIRADGSRGCGIEFVVVESRAIELTGAPPKRGVKR